MPSKRENFTPKQKAEAFLAARGKCQSCGIRLKGGDWDLDHDKACGLGGKGTLANAKVLCYLCHSGKTRKDVAVMRKADRQAKAILGLKKPRNPMPGSRGSKWRRKFDGTVERREDV